MFVLMRFLFRKYATKTKPTRSWWKNHHLEENCTRLNARTDFYAIAILSSSSATTQQLQPKTTEEAPHDRLLAEWPTHRCPSQIQEKKKTDFKSPVATRWSIGGAPPKMCHSIVTARPEVRVRPRDFLQCCQAGVNFAIVAVIRVRFRRLFVARTHAEESLKIAQWSRAHDFVVVFFCFERKWKEPKVLYGTLCSSSDARTRDRADPVRSGLSAAVVAERRGKLSGAVRVREGRV